MRIFLRSLLYTLHQYVTPLVSVAQCIITTNHPADSGNLPIASHNINAQNTIVNKESYSNLYRAWDLYKKKEV